MTAATRSPLRLGSPRLTSSLALFPIFADEPRLLYRSLGQAAKLGAFVSEVDDHGDVNEVLACNATDLPMLLFEGELIEGARQTRTIDLPVLVPAGAKVRVPVSCVEQGRWDERQRAAHFSPSAHTVDPDLRATKRAVADAQPATAAPASRRAQATVWQEVTTRLAEHDVDSASYALSDLYGAKRAALEQITAGIEPVEGQVGVVVEVSGRPTALDLVSRPEVFADLFPRLLAGYALQALHATLARPSQALAEEFLEIVQRSSHRAVLTPGIGEAFALQDSRVHGCGLSASEELIALSAFPAKG